MEWVSRTCDALYGFANAIYCGRYEVECLPKGTLYPVSEKVIAVAGDCQTHFVHLDTGQVRKVEGTWISTNLGIAFLKHPANGVDYCALFNSITWELQNPAYQLFKAPVRVFVEEAYQDDDQPPCIAKEDQRAIISATSTTFWRGHEENPALAVSYPEGATLRDGRLLLDKKLVVWITQNGQQEVHFFPSPKDRTNGSSTTLTTGSPGTQYLFGQSHFFQVYRDSEGRIQCACFKSDANGNQLWETSLAVVGKSEPLEVDDDSPKTKEDGFEKYTVEAAGENGEEFALRILIDGHQTDKLVTLDKATGISTRVLPYVPDQMHTPILVGSQIFFWDPNTQRLNELLPTARHTVPGKPLNRARMLLVVAAFAAGLAALVVRRRAIQEQLSRLGIMRPPAWRPQRPPSPPMPRPSGLSNPWHVMNYASW